MKEIEDYNDIEDLISIGNAMDVLVSSRGWKVIDEAITLKVETIDMKMAQTDDPYIVMACVRQKDGLCYVKELIKEFQDARNDAVLERQVNS